jgi:hypothetical protein
MSRFFVPVASLLAAVCLATTTGAARQAPSAPPDTGLAGHVTERLGGHPLPGALVTITGPGITRRVIAGTAGEFEMALPPGSYGVRADRPGYLPLAAGQQTPTGLGQAVIVKVGEHTDVPLALWKMGALAGTVLTADAMADPVVGAEIHALAKTVVAGSWAWVDAGVTSTDDHGRYRLSNLTPGDYLVVARPAQNPETALLVAMFTANPTQSADVMANVTATAREVPEVDARVLAASVAMAAAPGTPARPLVVGLEPGTARSGVDLRVRFGRGVRVAGRLSGATLPTAGLVVELLAAVPDAGGRERSEQQMQVATAACDTTGEFAFSGVPAGAYTIAVTWMPPLPPAPPAPAVAPNGRGPVPRENVPLFSTEAALWARTPVVVGATDLTNVTVPASKGPVLSGHVSVDSQNPSVVPNLEATSLRLEPVVAPFVAVPTLVAPRVVIGSTGRISSASMPPGRYWLRAGAPPGWSILSAEINGVNALDRPIDISATSADLVVTITDRRLGSLAGVATTGDVPATEPVTVVAFPVKADERFDSTAQSRRVRAVRAQAGSAFFIGALPPGEYCLVALAGDPPRGWQTEDVLANWSTSAAHVTVGFAPTDHLTVEVRR